MDFKLDKNMEKELRAICEKEDVSTLKALRDAINLYITVKSYNDQGRGKHLVLRIEDTEIEITNFFDSPNYPTASNLIRLHVKNNEKTTPSDNSSN